MNDLRYPHFADVRAALTGNRLAIWDAMLGFGACTGSELAAHIGWTVLSVRPRLTELRAISLAVLSQQADVSALLEKAAA